MIYFNSDYTEGAHERILQRLQETNMEQTAGYGEDAYCMRAADMIRRACDAPDAAVHFLVGGTQANTVVIAAALRPHQGVVAAETGHINMHETGAVEATGHKVLSLPAADGKIRAAQVEELCAAYRADESWEHIVQPGMVYLSQPTEYGTIYSRDELSEMQQVCRRQGLFLFVDGARLGYALAAEGNDVSLPELASLTDVFYIGGTKVGALFGEAVVITNRSLQQDFRCHMKQRGGMLAKGRLLGLQFLTLFEDGLYFELGRHADKLAAKIRGVLAGLGIQELVKNTTNQIFPIFSNALMEALAKDFSFLFMEKAGEDACAVRICTSWATTEEAVDSFCGRLKELASK